MALDEDVGSGDLTTEGLVDPGLRCHARIIVREPGVVAGIGIVEAVYRELSRDVSFDWLARDGQRIETAGRVIGRIDGPARALLTGERTALNLLGRLCGIATLTSRFVDAVAGTGAVILDTRKTTPGLRALEKYAVRCGGATNHRMGLYDAVLIKDNHVAAADGVERAVRRARAAVPHRPIEVEADTLTQVHEALRAGADRVLLDNMPLPALREAVAIAAGRVPLEASGGVSLATVRDIALTGVDFISVGALTHSACALDVSLEVLR
ncbi:MAG TPA: carboxylating nicotinate-nucleotide diphosphorylase [Candidatus Saccharimonadales bacterium]|nr:carboxylating nicotinate-nucleotide diphosphorylase [Candidatus Saccharimonadales bacterium]